MNASAGRQEMDAWIEPAWFSSTSNDLVRIVAGILQTQPKTVRSKLVNAVIAKLGAAGAYSGAFGVASLVGTAGTGTAIGTLSGAAAYSATLAWLGFGSMAVGGLVLPALTIAGGLVVVKAWKGRARDPDSLSTNERQLVSACTTLAAALQEQAKSEALPSGDEMRLFVSKGLRPTAKRLDHYVASDDFRAVHLRGRLAVRTRLVHLERRLHEIEARCNA